MATSKKLITYAATIKRTLDLVKTAEFGATAMSQIKVRMRTLEAMWQAYNAEYTATIEGVCEEELESLEQEYFSKVEENYIEAYALMEEKVVKEEITQVPANTGQAISVQVQMPVQQNDVKNTWGDFDGNLTKWTGFRDRFRAAVHDNEKIDPAFKFLYLTKSLVGRAKLTFGQWQFSAENYAQAWERLNQMHDQSYLIGREHLRRFIRLPELKGQVKANDLSKMSNVTHEVRRQLQAQGLPVEHWDFFMVHMLHERLDSETAKNWELVRDSDTPKLEQMLAFLDKQALALANIANNNRSAETGQERSKKLKWSEARSIKEADDIPSTSRAAMVRAMQCEICNENHMLYHCPEFMALTLNARKEYVARRNLCRNCLKKGHGPDTCFQGECWKCPGNPKHNSVLCPNREPKKQVASVQVKESRMQMKQKEKSE